VVAGRESAERKNVTHGVAHREELVQQHDRVHQRSRRQRLGVGICGQCRFSRARASRRRSPAQMAAEQCCEAAMEHGVRRVDVLVRGPGSGRETAVRSLAASGIEVTGIKDVTPIPHNGCRPKSDAGFRRGEQWPAIRDRCAGCAAGESQTCFLKGPKCESMACPIERRSLPTWGPWSRSGCGRVRSTSRSCVRSKRHAAFYGVLERQFRNLYEEANRQAGITGENLLRNARAAHRQRRIPCPLGCKSASVSSIGESRSRPM